MKDHLIFGIRPVIEAIRAGKELERVFLQNDLQGETSKELLLALKKTGIRYTRVPLQKLNKLTRKNHQGVVCLIALISYSTLEDVVPFVYEQGRSPLILVLDGITDVRNFGAIARTGECAGVDALIIPEKGGAQINADAMKTSAGALNNVPVCKVPSLVFCLKYLQQSGLQIIACTEKASKMIKDFDYTMPTAIVLGSEDKGISKECLALADNQASIPMVGNIGSLNVSVAAGMILYEAMCQRY
jgi:23S rRNA (guanosine2251-2'-O)-methyltransferase